MKPKFLGLLAFVAMGVVGADISHADTLIGTTSNAMGIAGLVVDGVTYNVTFVNDSYNNVYASTPPTFLGNQSGATDASLALASDLSSFGVIRLVGITDPTQNLFISYLNTSGTNSAAFVSCPNPCTSPWVGNLFGAAVDTVTYPFQDYAQFTQVSATPIPNVGLPGMGILLAVGGLLAWWRRKRTPPDALAAV